MARLKVGARVEMAGGEWVQKSGEWEPVFGIVLQVRDDGGCLVKFDEDDHAGWLRWTDLTEVSEEPIGAP